MNFLRQLLDMLLAPLRALVSSPGQLVSGSKRLRGISLAAKVALLVLAVLLVTVGVLVVLWKRSPNPTSWGIFADRRYLAVMVITIFAIPIVVYQLIKLWLEEDTSRYPDIDYAWKAGLAELASHGLDLSQTPLFLILGSANESRERALFGAAQLPLRVRDCPAGQAALRWYAGPDAIYLVTSEVGTMSTLAAMARGGKGAAANLPPSLPDEAPALDIRETLMLVRARQDRNAPSPAAGTPVAPPSLLKGTMMIGSQVADPAGGPEAPSLPPQAISAHEVQEQTDRLEYLCQLISREREPLCPINGAFALLPFDMVTSGWHQELSLVAQRDLGTMFRHLRICCPVVVLVTGMEQEPGFRELVRRVGKEKAINQRFGKGNPSVWNRPTTKQLKALAAHACGHFEDWIYELFRDKGALSRPGNTKLFSLLCTIRSRVHSALEGVLTAGFGVSEERVEEGLLIAGCYFAATGESDDRQAFVKGTLTKPLVEQLDEQIEWSEDALRTETNFRRWAQVIFWIDVALLLSLAAMVVKKFTT